VILNGKEVGEKLLEGISLVADTVAPTFGPQAKTVILQGNPPVVINDGVTITKYVRSEDPYAQLGVQLVQDLASKAQSKAGDGTTTACILARALCKSLHEFRDARSIHEWRTYLTDVRDGLLSYLDDSSIPVTDDDIQKIATIAANNDEKLGELIAEVFKAVGRNGVVSVEESLDLNTSFEIKEGLELESGYISHLFANRDNGDCVLENPLILSTNKIIRKFQDILPACEYASQKGRPLLLVCRGLQNMALQNVLLNVAQGRLDVGVIETPNYGDAQLDELKDLIAVVGGKAYSDEADDDLRIVNENTLGSCSKVVIDKVKTTIVGGNGGEAVVERIEALRKLHELGTNEFVKESISKRISRLSGGIAVIRVGAGSSVEMRDTKERLDDALNATKAALDGGYIVGGGLTILKFQTHWPQEKPVDYRMSMATLLSPIDTLMGNSEFPLAEYDIVINRWIEDKEGWQGFNAKEVTISDLLIDGIIDPTLVTKSSVSAAFSIAMMFLTTDVAVLLE
jgi:chaperonin GroEL